MMKKREDKDKVKKERKLKTLKPAAAPKQQLIPIIDNRSSDEDEESFDEDDLVNFTTILKKNP